MKFPQWLHRASRIARFALAVVALTATPVADAQSVLSDPDFSAMFAPGGSASIVGRDSSRGWKYVFSGTGGSGGAPYINGISVGRFSRVSDSGNVDLSWVGPDTQAVQITRAQQQDALHRLNVGADPAEINIATVAHPRKATEMPLMYGVSPLPPVPLNT